MPRARKLPCRKILDLCLDTLWRFLSRTLDSAFYVRHVFERRAEHSLLLGAVRAPIQPVHLYLFCSQALRECVVTGRAAVA